MQSLNEYLIIEIAEIDVWVPITDARTDVIAKKHDNLFLIPDACEILELMKIPNPIACWTVAKSKSFLMMWLIFNLRKMNANDTKADMITTIPNTVGIKRNLTPIIFALNFSPVLIFQSNQIFLMYTLVYTQVSSTITKQKRTLSYYGNSRSSPKYFYRLQCYS